MIWIKAARVGSVTTLSRLIQLFIFFFSSRRRHTRCSRDWSSDVCSSDLLASAVQAVPVDFLTSARHAVVTPSQVSARSHSPAAARQTVPADLMASAGQVARSGERRVGEEGRSRWAAYH